MKAVTICALGLSLVAIAARADDKITITQTSNTLGFAVDYIALDEGFFKRQGIDPEIQIVNGGDAANIPAVRTGASQFGAMTLVPALQADARGETLRVVAPLVREYVNQFVINADAAKQAGITEAMPLKEKFRRAKGMIVGTLDIGGGLHLMFQALAREYGLDPDKDYNITAIKSYPALLVAAKRGDIGLALTAIPYGTMGVQNEGLAWFADFWGGAVKEYDGTVHQGVVTTADYAEKNPDIVRRMNEAYDQTLKFIRAQPEKVVADIHKRYPGFSEELLHSFYVDDKDSFARSGKVERHGFELVRDFVAKGLLASAANVSYETFVLPVAQEK